MKGKNRGERSGNRIAGSRKEEKAVRKRGSGDREEKRDKRSRSGGRMDAGDGLSPLVPRALPVTLGGEYETEVVGISHEGAGVGRVNGFTLFIPGALPGEKASVRVTELKKKYGYASLLELKEASPDRTRPPCPVYSECGGCQLQHLSYGAQLRYKREQVVGVLERIGKLQVRKQKGTAEADSAVWQDGGALDDQVGVLVHETIGMAAPWRYRNKAQVQIGRAVDALGEEGGLVSGYYAQGSHRIIDMDACLIQHEESDAVVATVTRIARELGIRPYEGSAHRGLLRHVVVRYGFNTDELMIVLVTNGESIGNEAELIGLIRRDIPKVKSICQNVNTERTSAIFGEVTHVLWGSDVIYDTIGDIRFAISARSFYQVNPVQTEVLYGKALEYAGLSGEETVIDAYCGIGTISLFLARQAQKVYGVEIVPEAIEDARSNALLNHIRNAEFEVGAAEKVIPAWRERGITADVIVVDPPRKGCDPALLETIIAMRPERVVYVSCDPATLARDLRILEDGGFRTVEVQPVDMFPQSTHVECCVLLEWNKL